MRFLSLLIFIYVFFTSLIVHSQNLQFYREDLTFEIKDGFFYVDGIYNFCNKGDKEIKQILFYPFPKDSIYGNIDSIIAIDLNSKSINIISNKTEIGFYFKIELNSYGVGKYKISYRQKLLKNKAEYILLTTQKWDKPFDSANYKLITPAKMIMKSISYEPDSIKQINDNAIYFWYKKDFMPYQNMIFCFEI
ncbi:MAG: hypothetical protein A2033_01890 [Bacteroidetes bacterium GWA2_31_9]|nr:MAG: hypothetical protein A2033_01890 [Bacteroidetes bacterium GWA2_31_9]